MCTNGSRQRGPPERGTVLVGRDNLPVVYSVKALTVHSLPVKRADSRFHLVDDTNSIIFNGTAYQ